MNNTIKEMQECPMTKVIKSDTVEHVIKRFMKHAQEISEYWEDLIPLMTCSEMGELSAALGDFERDRVPIDDVINEMGDVIISIAAMASQYDIDPDLIIGRIALKLKYVYNEREKE